MLAKDIIENLIQMPHETEWMEFKTNFFTPDDIGEYISAISNSACMSGKKAGYMVWGIDNDTHMIVGTNFDFQIDYNHEPLEHYIARSLTPSIHFMFEEVMIDRYRLVLLTIPAAKDVPTEYKKERYIRIGSSKESLRKYPQREATLWNFLSHGVPSLTNTDSERQDLTFDKLFFYYSLKKKPINQTQFKKNLSLINEDSGKYNLLALLLSDDNAISVRVSVFNGTRKSLGLKSIKEFGNTCILYALDAIIDYGRDVLNIPITDETDRRLERNDVYRFNYDAYREAIINAFVHNDWMHLNAPQISVFTDRIEILSHGLLGADQTFDGFFKGVSRPVNPALAHVFMQLGISDRSGKGVPTIIDAYGKKCYTFNEDSISLILPFKEAFNTKTTLKDSVIASMKNNPFITASALSKQLHVSLSMINKTILQLKNQGKIERHGSNKNGSWIVVED